MIRRKHAALFRLPIWLAIPTDSRASAPGHRVSPGIRRNSTPGLPRPISFPPENDLYSKWETRFRLRARFVSQRESTPRWCENRNPFAGTPTMAMVCPQCKEFFEQRLQCPKCNARLIYSSAPHKQKTSEGGEAGVKWMHAASGRILLGVLLAQGLYFGLRRLCSAGLLAVDEGDPQGVWSSLFGVFLVQGLQALGLLVGGMLAGAGYRRGAMLGALVGA